jgi:hypothetical protein
VEVVVESFHCPLLHGEVLQQPIVHLRNDKEQLMLDLTLFFDLFSSLTKGLFYLAFFHPYCVMTMTIGWQLKRPCLSTIELQFSFQMPCPVARIRSRQNK